MSHELRLFRAATWGTRRPTALPVAGAAKHAPGRAHWKSLLSAVILGLILLILSSLINAAAAIPADGTLQSAGLVWGVPVAATLLVLWRARHGRGVARGMCFINGVVGLGL